MPTSYTSSLRMTNQEEGANPNTWGIIADNNFEFIDDAIAGEVSVDLTGSSSYTLTTNNGADDEARNAALYIHGIPTSANSVIIPAVKKPYIVRAFHTSVSGGINVRTNTGTGVNFLTGQSRQVYCDGLSVHAINTVSALDPSDNLSDLENVSAARDNLGVYSSAEVDTLVSNTVSTVTSAISTLSSAIYNSVSGFIPRTSVVNVSNAGTFGGSLFYARDQKTTNTAGGANSSNGSWFTRTINTVVVSASFASLNTNVITLTSGNYLAEWRCPGYGVNVFATKLYNLTNGSDIERGTSEYSPIPGANMVTNSVGFASFSLSVTTSVALQMQGATTQSLPSELGVATNIGPYEIYSLLKIWKRGN